MIFLWQTLLALLGVNNMVPSSNSYMPPPHAAALSFRPRTTAAAFGSTMHHRSSSLSSSTAIFSSLADGSAEEGTSSYLEMAATIFENWELLSPAERSDELVEKYQTWKTHHEEKKTSEVSQSALDDEARELLQGIRESYFPVKQSSVATSLEEIELRYSSLSSFLQKEWNGASDRVKNDLFPLYQHWIDRINNRDIGLDDLMVSGLELIYALRSKQVNPREVTSQSNDIMMNEYENELSNINFDLLYQFLDQEVLDSGFRTGLLKSCHDTWQISDKNLKNTHEGLPQALNNAINLKFMLEGLMENENYFQ